MKRGAGARVDLGPVRARVAKVKQTKRARAAARRAAALARAQAQAESAEAARANALRVWETEERRLANATPRPKTARRVRFAPNLTVTEIPVQHCSVLPAATLSPARLEDGPRDEIDDKVPPAIPFCTIEFEEEDDDGDTEYKPLAESANGAENVLATRVNPPRRARPNKLDQPVEENDTKSSKSSPNGSPNVSPTANGKSRKRKRRRASREGEVSMTESESNHAGSLENGKKRKVNGGDVAASPSKSREAVSDAGDELDNIFSNFANNRTKQREAAAEAAAAAMPSTSTGKEGKAEVAKNKKGKRFSAGSSREVRYTQEGYRIYTEDEIAEDQPKGLNGPCPFECSCCF